MNGVVETMGVLSYFYHSVSKGGGSNHSPSFLKMSQICDLFKTSTIVVIKVTILLVLTLKCSAEKRIDTH